MRRRLRRRGSIGAILGTLVRIAGRHFTLRGKGACAACCCACWDAFPRSIKSEEHGCNVRDPGSSPDRSWRRPRRQFDSTEGRNPQCLTTRRRRMPTTAFWYSGKVTRRRLIGYGAASAGALGATMLVPAPWRAAFGQAKPYKIGTLQPLSGAAAAGGKTALVGVQMAVDRINKVGRHQRPAGRADRRRLRVQARRRPPQGREAGRRGQDRRPCRRLPLQRVPRLHAGVRRGQDRQHDQRVPRHHDHHQQVQPLHLPAVRLRAGPGGGVRALPGQQDGQEVAHRLCRLRLGPVDPRRLCRADQEDRRRGRRHHRHPARHRRHDAVPVQDHRRLRRHLRHLLRQGRRSPSATRPTTSA